MRWRTCRGRRLYLASTQHLQIWKRGKRLPTLWEYTACASSWKYSQNADPFNRHVRTNILDALVSVISRLSLYLLGDEINTFTFKHASTQTSLWQGDIWFNCLIHDTVPCSDSRCWALLEILITWKLFKCFCCCAELQPVIHWWLLLYICSYIVSNNGAEGLLIFSFTLLLVRVCVCVCVWRRRH